MKMKVKLLARPDHSVGLYRELLSKNIDVEYFTFYSAREGSILNKILPNRKKVPSSASTLDFFTLISYTNNIIGRKLGYNSRYIESRLANYFFSKIDFSETNIIHYWPFYTAKVVEKLKLNMGIPTLAEFYEAEPSFVNEIYNSEYENFNINDSSKINLMIDQNECFSFEENIAVASDFTASTYKRLFPNKKYHILKYGPIGCRLGENVKKSIEEKSNTNNKSIVYVGQICLEKGVHYLIDAVKDSPYTLDLIGPIRSSQTSIFKQYFELNNINFLGSKSNLEVNRLLHKYKLFVLPSLADNYSLAVNEALSAGTPVIVTENCGNKDDIINYNLGYVVNVKSSSAIRGAIDKVINEFDWYKFYLGLDNFFNTEKNCGYVDRVISAYDKVISNA